MKNILTLCMVLLFMASCDDPYENDQFQIYDTFPTSTYLDTRPDVFSEWVKILHYADLYNALNQASVSYTVLVPNNQAVSAFYQKKGISSIEEMGKTYAQDLVKFHFLTARISQEEFLLGGKLNIPTASEDYLTVTFDENSEDGGYNAVFINEEARIAELNIETNNGVVYVLDAVMTPLVESLYQRLVENPDYSIFREAVELSGWKDRLNTPYDTTTNTSGSVTVTKKNFTMLVVTNQVYGQDGINSTNDLITKIGAGSDYTSDENALRKYVGYHLVNQSKYVEDILTFPDGETSVTWNTQAKNELFLVSTVDSIDYINYNDDNQSGIQFVNGRTDFLARNGVYHEIDNYMPVWSPKPVTVMWDFCDYEDIEAMINAYGVENGLGSNCFQVAQSAEYQPSIAVSSVTSYTYGFKSTLSTAWRNLGYLLCKTGNVGGSQNSYGAYKNDLLIINPGYAGWVQTTTPTIIRGKYKVELQYAYAKSLGNAGYGSGGSLTYFDIDEDDAELPAHRSQLYIYNGISMPGSGVTTATLFDELEFETTTAHTFKIMVMDARATNEKNFRLMLDYVKFTPID